MSGFDPEKTRAHRLAEARQGFPLLRGCANTAAISLCSYFARIGEEQWTDFATQLSDFAEAEGAAPGRSLEDLRAQLEDFPLVAEVLRSAFDTAPQPRRLSFASIPLKTVAGLMNDGGRAGLERWARMINADDMDFTPPAGFAATLEDLVAVAPKRLRKLIDDALASRFGVSHKRVSSELSSYESNDSRGRMKVDVMFPRPGPGSGNQFSYYFLRELPNGRRAALQSYESVWRIPATWNYVTEANADRTIAHFAGLIDVCDGLV